MVNTVYNMCYDMLFFTIEQIKNLVGYDYRKISAEILKFLTTNNSRYEVLFEEYEFLILNKKKEFYKKIMMLIIASSSYYLSLYFYHHDISIEESKFSIDQLENLNYIQIINNFMNWKDNIEIFNLIYDFLEFYDKNYILQNNCMEEVLKYRKKNYLLKINPFEILKYIDYIEPSNLLESERMIEDFIDIYYSSLYHATLNSDDNRLSFILNLFKEKVEEKYITEDKIQEFYSYIFSNIYETVNSQLYEDFVEEYEFLINELKNINFEFLAMYEKFLFDDEFAIELINFFVDTNNYIYKEDLLIKRENFKHSGNVLILQDLNPFYEEEELVFKKIKEKNFPNL